MSSQHHKTDDSILNIIHRSYLLEKKSSVYTIAYKKCYLFLYVCFKLKLSTEWFRPVFFSLYIVASRNLHSHTHLFLYIYAITVFRWVSFYSWYFYIIFFLVVFHCARRVRTQHTHILALLPPLLFSIQAFAFSFSAVFLRLINTHTFWLRKQKIVDKPFKCTVGHACAYVRARVCVCMWVIVYFRWNVPFHFWFLCFVRIKWSMRVYVYCVLRTPYSWVYCLAKSTLPFDFYVRSSYYGFFFGVSEWSRALLRNSLRSSTTFASAGVTFARVASPTVLRRPDIREQFLEISTCARNKLAQKIHNRIK